MSTHTRDNKILGGSNHGRIDAAGGLHGTSSFHGDREQGQASKQTVAIGGKSTSSSTKSLNLSDSDYDFGSDDIPKNNTKSSRAGGSNNERSSSSNTGEEPRYMRIKNLNRIPMWLAPCHMVAAIFQCMQAFIMFALSSLTVDLKWAVATNFPVPYNPDEEQEDALLQETEQDPYGYLPNEGYEEEPAIYAQPGESQIIGYYSVTWLAGFFILCSGIDHIYCLLPGLRAKYEYYVERHQSPIRWIEYATSCALIRVCICQVAGVTDIHLIVAIFVMTATSIFFPMLHERANAKARADGYPQDWLGFFMGVFAHLGAWSIIFSYYFESIKRGQPPAFASTIVFSLFFLDLTFPICFVLQWKKVGAYKDYLVGEFTFIMLSFTSKSFLAWVALVGSQAFTQV